MKRLSVWVLLGLALFTLSTTGLLVKAETPSEYECRPYIEKAIQELKTESAEAPVEDVSQEDIDVTSQEEEANTAAEELSTEETDTTTDDASDAITPSEEVQEQLFADDADDGTADSEPLEDDLASEATTVSEEEAPLSEEEDTADTDAEDAASEEIDAEASEENEETEEPAEASEESANQVLEDGADEDEDDENDDDNDDDENQENAVDETSQSTEQEENDSQEQPSSVEEAADEDGDDQNEDSDAEDVADSKENTQEQVEEDDDDGNDDNDENDRVENSEDDIENSDEEEAKAASGSNDDGEQSAENNEVDLDANDDNDDDDDDEEDDEEAGEADEENRSDIRESEENIEQSEENVKDLDSAPEIVSNEIEETSNTSNENDENAEEATESVETEDANDSTENDVEENNEDDQQSVETEDANDSSENDVEENNEDDQDDDDDDDEQATSSENEDELSEEAAAESQEQTSEEEAVTESSEDEAAAEPSEEAEQQPAEVSAVEDTESTEEIVETGEQSTEQEEISEEQVLKQESEEIAVKVEEIESDETAPGATDESFPEEDLLLEYEIPTNLRDTSHVYELLNINDDASEREKALQETADVILRDLKRIYDNSIKPLETLYKYRDLSNRHFGDPEIFSKPLVLFMGPWSGGKSTILNYLTHNEYTPNSVRTGAEPSPAYFNILMHGERPEVLDGTQLAADWTFSGLQKFGQGLLDRLRGQKLPNKLLERVNIVEIPGILEVRKQVSKYFPFNDACQWFIDRADIIFLVYDPSKLDVGPETEAILDQLKGREYQTRILLNKADQVKPEELLRVQSALIWNISPLMSSAQPPVMYTVSLWSNPYEAGAPVRLLQAQERTLLLDLGQAIEKRIENKIASARRFAVRIRNHAKMVDCYLTTYYNHKTLFGNKKQISEKIIASPQDYHIYEGLSTLTNISRYDLPDPEVYRDFFHLNPLYEFKKLSETCTYFRGCPINKLDVAIAYELPELVGKYKKMSQAALTKLDALTSTSDFAKGKSTS
ncbi:sarcalumenin-like isoform X2 [Anopheles albimanus]|uniref:sarcalumenin-like isoform X2 n=1 Tax=Anopheles albimanus TaxID=7167 RepID=UPI00163DF4E9|nr:sarcalumenin-like isoform X2 [Anopheles albimanus]